MKKILKKINQVRNRSSKKYHQKLIAGQAKKRVNLSGLNSIKVASSRIDKKANKKTLNICASLWTNTNNPFKRI